MRHLNAWILLFALTLMLCAALACLPEPQPEHVHAKISLEELGGLVRSGDGALVDINSANAQLLRMLPGIGTVLAERIVRDRLENGAFHSIEELARVPGIGAAKLDAIRELVICAINQ